MPNEIYGDRKAIAQSIESLSNEIDRISRGRINVSGQLQVEANETETEFFHPSIGQNSFIGLFPQTPEASAVLEKFAEIRSLRQIGKATFRHPPFDSGFHVKYMALVIG